MFSTQSEPKFKHKYPFLGIYSPKQTLNHNSFHFYSEPQPGFQQVSLHRKSARKPITMYYQKIAIDEYVLKHQNVADTSTIIDFQYFSTRRKNDQGQKLVVDRSKMVRQSEWVKKYQPTKFIQLLTDDMINRNLLTWVKSWDSITFNKSAKKKTVMPMMFNRNTAPNSKFQKPGQMSYLQSVFTNPKKMILLAGPPGCGKTTLVRVLANHCKYQVVQINASDDRSANNLIRKIEDIAGNNTIRGNKKPALICLDQIDGVAEGEASGIAKVLEYIQTGKKPKRTEQSSNREQDNKEKGKTQINFTANKAKDAKNKKNEWEENKFVKKENNNMNLNRPVVFICNDPFAKSLKQLRSKAHVIYFTQLSQDRVVKRMREILEKEKVVIQLQVLHKICQICRNDIRSCIGVLELVARQKKINNKNPKDVINKMKLSFAKDNQSSINQFLQELFSKKTEASYLQKNAGSNYTNFGKYLQTQVFQIYNPSLLMQTFLQNFLSVQGVARKGKLFLRIYEDLIKSDILMKNGFKYNNQLERYHVLPYFGFSCHFGGEEYRKIQFPSMFFEKLRKIKANKQLVKTIYSNIPIQLRIFLNKQSFLGCYLFAIYMAMQTSSTKETEIIRCVSYMLTYGFALRKQKQMSFKQSIFTPQIDTLFTFGQRKPEILISNVIKTLMEQNYQFFKERKQMLVDHQLRDNTTAMINQMHLHSRKKRNYEKSQGLKYKFIEGTGTKISYSITMSYFFQ